MVQWGSVQWLKFTVAASALAFASGCGGPVDVNALNPKPPTIMVAKKLDLPLYIVLDQLG